MVEWRLRTGAWVAVRPGVYRIAGAPVTWHQRLMAACLASGGVASHRAGAALWGLEGFEPGPVEVVVPGPARRRLAGVRVHRTRDLPRADVGEVDGIPVTRPARTLVDLASVAGGDRLEGALDSALRQQLVTVAYVDRRLAAIGSAGRPGVAALRELLAARTERKPAGSQRGNRLAQLAVAAGLPAACPNAMEARP
jgi:predicted transcriptional regulator of viral defense system